MSAVWNHCQAPPLLACLVVSTGWAISPLGPPVESPPLGLLPPPQAANSAAAPTPPATPATILLRPTRLAVTFDQYPSCIVISNLSRFFKPTRSKDACSLPAGEGRGSLPDPTPNERRVGTPMPAAILNAAAYARFAIQRFRATVRSGKTPRVSNRMGGRST